MSGQQDDVTRLSPLFAPLVEVIGNKLMLGSFHCPGDGEEVDELGEESRLSGAVGERKKLS